MKYAIYSPATGKILRTVDCPSALALAQLAQGEALLPDLTRSIGDSTHRVEDGQFVEIVPPQPTEAEIRARFVGYAQVHMDLFARTWGYDDVRSAVSYVGDPYPRFNAEGLALRDWRSAVWAYLDAAGATALPDPLPTREEFLVLLPPRPARP